jgi:hypothetical protein
MIKTLMKFFSYTLFFIFALTLFIPKNSIYYFAEKNLKEFDVIISNESLEDTLLTLKVKNPRITLKAIEAASIEELDITLALLYNKIYIKNIALSSLVKSYLPSKLEYVAISYTLINPFVVYADALGEFGDARVEFNLKTRALQIFLHPSKKMFSHYKNSLKEFKKSETGEYVYAKNF